MVYGFLMVLLALGAFVLALRRVPSSPAGLRGRIRARGWGLLLLPVALSYAALAGRQPLLILAEVVLASIVVVNAPRLATKTVPYALLALGGYGLVLALAYH